LRNEHSLNLFAKLEHISHWFASLVPLNHHIREVTGNRNISRLPTSRDSQELLKDVS
jgi:hypothetical protein